jgi:hypothetical protein
MMLAALSAEGEHGRPQPQQDHRHHRRPQQVIQAGRADTQHQRDRDRIQHGQEVHHAQAVGQGSRRQIAKIQASATVSISATGHRPWWISRGMLGAAAIVPRRARRTGGKRRCGFARRRYR